MWRRRNQERYLNFRFQFFPIDFNAQCVIFHFNVKIIGNTMSLQKLFKISIASQLYQKSVMFADGF